MPDNIKDGEWLASCAANADYRDVGGYCSCGAEKAVEKYLTDSFGPRCKTKDIEDIPEKELNGSRCLTCEQWEYYDDWVQLTADKEPKNG